MQHRERLERYLLGTLDDEAAAEVRERAIRDPAVFEELREIELDLLDAAARGALQPARQQLVEARLVSAAHNRDAWTLARALGARDALQLRPTRAPLSARAAASPAWWRTVLWPAAAVAAIAVLALVVRDWGREPGGRGEAVATRADRALPPERPVLEPESPPAATGERPRAAAPPETPSTGSARRVVALYLPARTVRGALPQVELSASVATLQLELEIAPPVPSAVDVVVRAVTSEPEASRQPLWSADGAAVQADGADRFVSLAIPAAGVPAGIVDVTVTSPDAGWPARTFSFLVRLTVPH